VTLDAAAVPDSAKIDDSKPIMVTDDGYGGTDQLVSIEKILGTSQSDKVVLRNLDLSAYGLSQNKLEIDLSGVKDCDIVDASGLDKALDLKVSPVSTEFPNSGLTIKNAEIFIGTAYGDLFQRSLGDGKLDLRGGAGQDTVQYSSDTNGARIALRPQAPNATYPGGGVEVLLNGTGADKLSDIEASSSPIGDHPSSRSA
jgi:hypothetical protein